MIMDDTPNNEPAALDDDDEAADSKHAQAYLSAIHAGLTRKRAVSVSNRKAAEALVVDALEAENDDQMFVLLVSAIRLDPCNAEALLALREFFSLTLEEDMMALRALVSIAEKRLGKKVFKECAGMFWGYLETRPYMRARAALAELYLEAGMGDAAVAEWEAMLLLNTNDNQGFRYLLLPRYLEANNREGTARLFETYKDDCEWSAMFVWGRLLDRLLQGDSDGASQALAKARKTNGYLEAYLLGHRSPPKELPDVYRPGSREEAECYAEDLMRAWNAHPDALTWLKAQPKPRR